MSKLTLSVDPAVVRQAKRYAQAAGKSVSRLVEDYLALVAGAGQGGAETPGLRRVRGILKRGNQGAYRDYLARKYR